MHCLKRFIFVDIFIRFFSDQLKKMTPPTCVLRVALLLWLCLHPVRTVRVDLSRQQLNTVPRTITRDVKILILNHNGLRTLNNSSFDLYADLEELSLEYCKIGLIQEGTFDRQVKLQIISFSHNSIRQLPITFGPSVNTIIEINLWAAYVSGYVFNYPYFSAFHKLLILNIGKRNADNFDFKNIPPSVMSFKAYRSELSTFPNFSHLQNLENLYLGFNRITTIPRDYIDGLKQLSVLKVNGNRITLMPNISYLSVVKRVVLNQNYISYLPAGTLNGLQHLKILELSANKISYVDDISHLSLSFIDLSSNNLRLLPDLYGQKLKTLYLHDNPIVCNQSLCWLRMWPWYQTPPEVDNVVCAEPQELTGLEIMKVHPNVLECYNGMLNVVPYYIHLGWHFIQNWILMQSTIYVWCMYKSHMCVHELLTTLLILVKFPWNLFASGRFNNNPKSVQI